MILLCDDIGLVDWRGGLAWWLAWWFGVVKGVVQLAISAECGGVYFYACKCIDVNWLATQGRMMVRQRGSLWFDVVRCGSTRFGAVRCGSKRFEVVERGLMLFNAVHCY